MQTVGIPNKRYTVALGYVILPSEDRNKYVETVFRTERLSIFTENGELINDVLIDRNSLQLIEIPETIQNDKGTYQLGSCVVLLNEFVHNKPFVIAVLSKDDETQLLKEKEFRLVKRFENNTVLISGDATTGTLFLKVIGGSGSLKIDIQNDENTASLDLNIKGNININNEGETTLNTTKTVYLNVLDAEGKPESNLSFGIAGLIYSDKYENQITIDSEGTITIKPKEKLILHEGSEPIPKGDKLKTQLEKLSARLDLVYNAIKNGTPVPGDGGTAYKVSMVTILEAEQKESFTDINSEKSFTD